MEPLRWVAYRVGYMFRETGQALERLGNRMQGSNAYLEPLWRHRTVFNLVSRKPELGSDVFVAPSAAVIGSVKLGDRASVWYGTVLRGDGGSISVGQGSNLQDGVLVRTARSYLGAPKRDVKVSIGERVTVGHAVVMEGDVTLEDECLIGIGAALQHGAKVEKGAMVAAGSVVSAGTTVPAGQLWAGNPARFMRPLTPDEAAFIPKSADVYAKLGAEHARVAGLTPIERAQALLGE